jgi:hypothetical protein
MVASFGQSDTASPSRLLKAKVMDEVRAERLLDIAIV